MRVISKDFKAALTRITLNGDSSNQAQDQRIDRLLSQLNQQIQALDDELDSEFSSIVASLEGAVATTTQGKNAFIGS